MIGGGTTMAAVVGWAMVSTTYAVWAGLLTVTVLLILSVPLIGWVPTSERDPWLHTALWWALAVKLTASLARWAIAFLVYGGVADAGRYARVGSDLAVLYRQGVFTIQTERDFIGTGFLMVLTGIVFVFTGPTIFGGFFVFSWLGYWGSVLIYLAVRDRVPELRTKRYAALLLFMPSMLYWPASIGKEAWMLFCIGVAVFGLSRALARRKIGYVWLSIGMLGTTMVRPHMSALLFAAAALALLFRPTRARTPMTPLYRLGAAAILTGVGLVVAKRASSFLGLSELSLDGVLNTIHGTAALTDEGGSTFRPHPVHTPLDLPIAAFTVLFRPMPWEAHNPQILVTAAEGVLLLGLLALSWRSLRALPQLLRGNSFLLGVTLYVLLFVVAFSAFGNFGILARERVQVYPFVMLFACLLPSSQRSTPPVNHLSVLRPSKGFTP